MGSFLIWTCDRCKAQFPEPSFEMRYSNLRPIQILRVIFESNLEQKMEMCKPCREEFHEMLRQFISREGK